MSIRSVVHAVAFAAVLSSVLAQSTPLTVNDVAAQALEVDGQLFVSIDDLRAAGMLVEMVDGTLVLRFGPPIVGGSDQVQALEGCADTALFNGVWRFQVVGVERYQERSLRGWDVEVEIANGSSITIAPRDFGFHPLHDGIALALESGRVLTMGGGYVGQIQQQLLFRQLPPGASARTTFRFLDDGDDAPPVRLVVPVTPDEATFRAEGLAFATDAPSFRIRLDCD